MPDELNERPDDNIDAWVAENGNTTDETKADLVESAIVPHIVKYGGGLMANRGIFSFLTVLALTRWKVAFSLQLVLVITSTSQ